MAVEKRKSARSSVPRPVNRRRTDEIVETALVEPNSLFREGMEHILARTRLQVVAKTDTLTALLASSTGHKAPRLAILAMEGVDAPSTATIGALKARYPDCRIVCLIQGDHSDASVDLLKSGADGVLLRSIGADAFVRSLELVMLGERVLPAAALSAACSGECREATPAHAPLPDGDQPGKPEQAPRYCNLSSRELAILRCLVQGESNKIIAQNLDIAEATVKVHVKAILRKTHVQNRTQAAIWALNHLADCEPSDLEGAANGSHGQVAPVLLPGDGSIRVA
ncbi:response regulator transcription factor [Methylobacterium sp. E-041]|uniref:LuxR C-terminal-related transcriptional regulator n=1 Tax=unclassified Methylobacterium TaxID=2615210 RepID=UPI0011C9AB57|nr:MULTISPECIES: response regulator transcription factor [unclassified Methylobacterium]MCJ2104610.1 response regulator transcription factor [Methylobacterium sp. E-041]TXN41944.1 response regulator transcription factor [Methylobacterium sp. WL93]TXN51964.1 response regulator transcription factor [Methylobacterium sp. WL119]TXN68813.1 response regulator transcription factor [Methylobacterium sp. WL30]